MNGKNIKVKIGDFISEHYISDDKFDMISFLDDDGSKVLVNTFRIRELFSFVGSSIRDIKYSSVFNKSSNEWANEVIVEFVARENDSITHSTWDKLNDILQSMLGKNGFTDFNIIPDRNKVILDFTEMYQMKY